MESRGAIRKANRGVFSCRHRHVQATLHVAGPRPAGLPPMGPAAPWRSRIRPPRLDLPPQSRSACIGANLARVHMSKVKPPQIAGVNQPVLLTDGLGTINNIFTL